MLRKCTRLIDVAVQHQNRNISFTSCRHSIEEFFPDFIIKEQKDRQIVDSSTAKPEDIPKFNVGLEDLAFGRSWKKSDLHALKSPVLHSLWYVLLKERNKCLTADAYHRQHLGETSSYVKRLASVQESMENLKEVIEERELDIDIAKTHLWMKRVSSLLGEEYAKELAATYVTYTLPHTEAEKKEMIEMKHHQLFSREFNRKRQPYEQFNIEYEMTPPKDRLTKWEENMSNYESDSYVHDEDFEPGLEGFLHNIKRDDWEELEKDPEDMVESRERREEDRLKIIKKLSDKRRSADIQAELANLKKWKVRVEGHDSLEKGPD